MFTPLTTGLFDDRWYTKPAQTYFYQKDIMVYQEPKLEVPTIYKAYIRLYMVLTYLHFRLLEFPLAISLGCTGVTV